MQTHNYFWNYLPLLFQILAAIGLSGFIVLASWLIGRHRPGKVKLSTYECGMVAQGDARGRFSVRFYMVADNTQFLASSSLTTSGRSLRQKQYAK